MQEMVAHIANVMVMTPQLGAGVTAVVGSFLLARQRFRQLPLAFHPGGHGLGGISDSSHLGAVSRGGDQKRRQAAVDADPAAVVSGCVRRVLLGGV